MMIQCFVAARDEQSKMRITNGENTIKCERIFFDNVKGSMEPLNSMLKPPESEIPAVALTIDIEGTDEDSE